MRILQEESIGLVIDIQSRLFPHINNHDSLEKNVSILIKGLEVLNIPIVVTEQYTKGLGPTIDSLQSLIQNKTSIEKLSFSCCDNAEFSEHLALQGKYKVIIAGIEAHVCVLQTVIDLIHNAYTPIVVENCISSRNENDKQIAIKRMMREGAIITTYESILFELCRFAGNDTFKKISSLVK